jgi:hypothetical protein
VAWPETGLFQPATHEADFGFDEPLPEVAIRFDLERTNGSVRFNSG